MNDDAHQLTSVAASRPSDAARYRYDAAGNPVVRAELGLDVTNSFNNLNQIVTGSWTGSTVTVAGSVNYPVGSISVNGQPGTVYPDASFDVAGVPVVPGTNTLTASYVGPAYTNVPMTATGTSTVVLGDTAYTHDANGNLTGDATFIYQYDTANQLTNVVRKADNTTVLSCRYDALGRRVEAIRADGTVDRYIYFPGSFLVLAVLDGNNTPKEYYTRGPDLSGTLDSAGGIGGILACTYSNALSAPLYHHADLMGNIIALTDSSGAVASTFHYTSFGQLALCNATVVPRNLFASKEWDIETRFVYYGYRYYSPNEALWMSRDPLEEFDGGNLYTFMRNGVLNKYDAWGLMARASKRPTHEPYNKPNKCGSPCKTANGADGCYTCKWVSTQGVVTGGEKEAESHAKWKQMDTNGGWIKRIRGEHYLKKYGFESQPPREGTTEWWNPTLCFERPQCDSDWHAENDPPYLISKNTGQHLLDDNGNRRGSNNAPDHNAGATESKRICYELNSRSWGDWSRKGNHKNKELGVWCSKCVPQE